MTITLFKAISILQKRYRLKTFTAAYNRLRRYDWPAYIDPVRGVIFDVPDVFIQGE